MFLPTCRHTVLTIAFIVFVHRNKMGQSRGAIGSLWRKVLLSLLIPPFLIPSGNMRFKTTTYLHNRTITPVLHYHSPYQKLYSKVLDNSFLKTFGFLCYPFLKPYNHHKIDFRSLPCVFIGYSASHKGYLCYHQPSSRIYIARHVVFNEDVFPFSTTLPPTPPIQSLLLPQSTTDPAILQLSTSLSPTLLPSPPHTPIYPSPSVIVPSNNTSPLLLILPLIKTLQ